MATSQESQSKPIHILFVGAGAVGCFYASRLHHPERNIYVSLVCRSNYKAIYTNGVTMKTHTFGDYHFNPHEVYASIYQAANSPDAPPEGWDYIVVTTKALPDVTNDAKDIEPLVRRAPEGKTCILLIQNGVGIEEAHRELFPKNPVVSAVTIISAEQISHGVIRQNRWTRISMGPYSDGQAKGDPQVSQRGTQCVKELVKFFNSYGGLRDAEEYDEIALQEVRWHKICINGAFNPSAVLSGGIGNADMVMDPEVRAHLKACMEEVFEAVKFVLGRPFSEKLATPDRILKSTERNTGSKPSMLLDWEAGRPMELEVILGNPVRIAKRNGYTMARLHSSYALLKSAQTVRSKKSKEGGSKI